MKPVDTITIIMSIKTDAAQPHHLRDTPERKWLYPMALESHCKRTAREYAITMLYPEVAPTSSAEHVRLPEVSRRRTVAIITRHSYRGC